MGTLLQTRGVLYRNRPEIGQCEVNVATPLAKFDTMFGKRGHTCQLYTRIQIANCGAVCLRTIISPLRILYYMTDVTVDMN